MIGRKPPRPRKPRRRSDMAGMVGQALQRQRLLRGLTQAQAAEKAGTSTKYIGEIERGDANPTMAIVQAVADTVGWKPGRGAGRIIPKPPFSARLLIKLMRLQHRHMEEVAEFILNELEPQADPEEVRVSKLVSLLSIPAVKEALGLLHEEAAQQETRNDREQAGG